MEAILGRINNTEEVMAMPVITVQMLEGRTDEQKRPLAKAITEAMVKHANARADAVEVIFHEVSRTNWARGGTLLADQAGK